MPLPAPMSASMPTDLGRPIRLDIDRRAFVHNIELAERLAAPAKTLVVIKADAYGHGMLEMARLAGERDLAVASSDEAQRLGLAGINNRTWVLEGPFSTKCLALSTKQPLVWVVHSTWQLALIEQCSHLNLSIWLKLDTGMHRLGFAPEQVAELKQWLSKQAHVEFFGWFTHFANGDQWQHGMTDAQQACMQQTLSAAGVDHQPQCLANSAGLLKHKLSLHDWVRPGIMLYGGISRLQQGELQNEQQRPVMRLHSRVMALRSVAVGESVGYGATWLAERDSVIATVAVGYGDGYPRSAPNGTPVLVAGQRAALAGRVSMDMIGVDVTDISGVQVGDEVELWGPKLPIEDVAEYAGTISYELMTRVTARVPKVYF